MKIQYLLTTVGKSREEIVQIIEGLNIAGDILVGNQLMGADAEYELSGGSYHAKIFDMTSKGVSKNRNFLISRASAEYITFLDDDMYCEKGAQESFEEALAKNQYNCVRFNVVSDNPKRPIKFVKKNGFVGFRSLSSFGVWGGFYKLDFLKQNSIYFREDVGPGTDINHGEDGIFNKQFTRFSKIFSITLTAFHIRQTNSTWLNSNRDLKVELVSHGFNYYLLYKNYANIMSSLFLLTHMKCYPKGTKYHVLKKYMKIGIRHAKETGVKL